MLHCEKVFFLKIAIIYFMTEVFKMTVTGQIPLRTLFFDNPISLIGSFALPQRRAKLQIRFGVFALFRATSDRRLC